MAEPPGAPRAERPADESVGAAGIDEDALDVEGLKLRGDVGGLLDLARAYRSGAGPGGRNMKRCYDAYAAAAELGSADAEFAAALFWMSGGVVPRDPKEGATRLRAAADKGSLPARVYLGNLYELGVHYKADPEKADVWYRNAARAANVRDEPGSPGHARALAELGCVRYVLERVAGAGLPEEEKARLLQRARAHGYGLRTDGAEDPPDASAAPGRAPAEVEAEHRAPAAEDRPRPAKRPVRGADRAPVSAAIGAFGYALLFMTAGVGAGYAGMLGARELVARGQSLPGLGPRADLVFPVALGALGVLPSALVYRPGSVLKAALAGAALGGVGWVAWGTGQAVIHASRAAQGAAFGIAGFLAALFVLGLLGGTKRAPRRSN
jgi:hypothetical protein